MRTVRSSPVITNVAEGGVAPSAGVIAAVRQATRLSIYVMIRPPGGSSHFSPAVVGAIATDARTARELGAGGLVVGALTPEGAVDQEAMLRGLHEGRLPDTFHRAFEAVSDSEAALEQVASLPYVERILTSGSTVRPEAAVGVPRQIISRSRLEIMVGAGVTRAKAALVLREKGATALHAATAARHPAEPTAGGSAALVAEMRRTVGGEAPGD